MDGWIVGENMFIASLLRLFGTRSFNYCGMDGEEELFGRIPSALKMKSLEHCCIIV